MHDVFEIGDGPDVLAAIEDELRCEMATKKQVVYVVSVKGHPGHGARTTDKAYALKAQEALLKRYNSVKIVEKRR